MESRIVQVSDLHLGSADPEIDSVIEGLRALVASERPTLIVASGDLTHRNRAEQHRDAAQLLRSFGPPVLAVPGNHDIPALPPRRLTSPFARFQAEWEHTEPVFESPEIVVVGLNSVRGWLYQEGLLRSAQLDKMAETLARAPSGAVRVVVTHHHLASAPWRSTKRPLMPRQRVLERLADAGADVILGGHIHQASSIAATELRADHAHPTILVTAPGLGRPRHGRHVEARGVNTLVGQPDAITVRTHGWRDGAFAVVAERRYPRRALT